MPIQKITLGAGGIVVPKSGVSADAHRMRPFAPKLTKFNQPDIHLNRLQSLLQSGVPRICVIRGEGLGDVIMTTPTVHALRHTFKQNLHLTYATHTTYLEGALVKYLKYNPDIDAIIDKETLEENDYDLIVNLHCPCYQKEKKGTCPPNRIDIFANHTGIPLVSTQPRYFPQRSEIDEGHKYFDQLMPNDKVVLVQPFSSTALRSPNPRELKKAVEILYSQYGVKSLVLTHDTDHKAENEIMWREVPGVQVVHNVDIRGIAGIMAHCDLVLCPDSSVLHMTGALGVPCVSIFTRTHPDARINHYPNAEAIWDAGQYQGCPCWGEGCHLKDACVLGITGGRIADACMEKLNNSHKIDIESLFTNKEEVIIETEIL